MLTEGATFGELSVVRVGGNMLGERRAVSVRSLGYSDVYFLAQEDVSKVLIDYPNMRVHLYDKGKFCIYQY